MIPFVSGVRRFKDVIKRTKPRPLCPPPPELRWQLPSSELKQINIDIPVSFYYLQKKNTRHLRPLTPTAIAKPILQDLLSLGKKKKLLNYVSSALLPFSMLPQVFFVQSSAQVQSLWCFTVYRIEVSNSGASGFTAPALYASYYH